MKLYMLFHAFMNNCLLFYSLKNCEPEFLMATLEIIFGAHFLEGY